MDLSFQVDDNDIPWPTGWLFCGQYAAVNAQVYENISMILLDFPNVSSIVEIGTFGGALTMYLGLWGLRLGVPVHTFDIEPGVSKDVHHILDKLGVTTHWVDVFSEQGMRELLDVMKEPGYLICDGGDKQREFETFAPLVPTGTVISVHDWGTEVQKIDGNILRWHYKSELWSRHDAMFCTVQKLGDAEEALANFSEEQLKDLKDSWVRLVSEKART